MLLIKNQCITVIIKIKYRIHFEQTLESVFSIKQVMVISMILFLNPSTSEAKKLPYQNKQSVYLLLNLMEMVRLINNFKEFLDFFPRKLKKPNDIL